MNFWFFLFFFFFVFFFLVGWTFGGCGHVLEIFKMTDRGSAQVVTGATIWSTVVSYNSPSSHVSSFLPGRLWPVTAGTEIFLFLCQALTWWLKRTGAKTADMLALRLDKEFSVFLTVGLR